MGIYPLDNLGRFCIECNTLNTIGMNEHNELTDSRRKVLSLHQAGLTPREIANALDLSTQRVYQQLRKLGLPTRRPDEQEAS